MRFGYHNILWIFLALTIAVFCFMDLSVVNTASQSGAASKEYAVKNGPIKNYDNNGNLKTLVNYDNGIKEGISYIFYPNGQVMLEMPYRQGKREGESHKYYEDGSLYAVTPYTDDELSGVRRTYYNAGGLKAEIPYFKSLPGLGLKEYDQKGTLKQLPLIIAHKEGDIWYFSITNCRNATFYAGALLNNQYFSPDHQFVAALPNSPKGAYLKVNGMPPGSLNVICKCTTKAGHPYVLRSVY